MQYWRKFEIGLLAVSVLCTFTDIRDKGGDVKSNFCNK